MRALDGHKHPVKEQWRIHRLLLATVQYPDWHPRTGVGPVYGFAIAGPGGYVLYDTGIGPPHPTIDRLYSPTRYQVDRVLRRTGLPAVPMAIVLSHLHFDHCGNVAQFPGVPTFVQAREWAAAQEEGYTIREFFDAPGMDFRRVDGMAAVTPGIEAIATPGHTPGHQSLAISTMTGLEVIGGQAAETVEDWERHIAGDETGLSEEARQSLNTLAAIDPRAVHFSHDDRVWSR